MNHQNIEHLEAELASLETRLNKDCNFCIFIYVEINGIEFHFRCNDFTVQQKEEEIVFRANGAFGNVFFYSEDVIHLLYQKASNGMDCAVIGVGKNLE